MLTREEIEALPPDGGSDYNRLVFERSPYLLQHSRDPVDWYPWGDEAFERAQREHKPVFLSIGYSTCHWCHVMEKESFEDPAVARLMNDVFVCVKVDREERPDVDAVYMKACQAMTGGGGWPLTVIMTPEKKPFFAATYVPKSSKYGRVGMLALVPQILSLWTERGDDVLESAERIISALRDAAGGEGGTDLGPDILDRAYNGLVARFDAGHGGFGSAPKFPSPHNLLFLLRYWRRTGEEHALRMVEDTLDSMRRGGIFDHVGLGFHRYSTDREWMVPHFEKMLYDQAMLAMGFVEAYQATSKEKFAMVAHEVFEYVLSEMTSPEGCFYSAEDADSEGEEGKYYLWTLEEVTGLLGPEDGGLFAGTFNLSEEGNFREETGGTARGRNIPHLRRRITELAEDAGISESEYRNRIERSRRELLNARRRRVPPFKDDKVLADWNGLMIAALAKGAQALNEPRYAKAAKRAADFVLGRMRDGEGNLLHRFRDGEAGIAAFLDDYAFLAWGVIELYEATFEIEHLRSAIGLAHKMIDHFWDERAGGFFLSGTNSEALILRDKDAYDGAIPSGNSVAALVTLRLGRAVADASLEEYSAGTIRAFSKRISAAPVAYAQMMAAVDFALGPSHEVVIAGDPAVLQEAEMLATLRSIYAPNKVVLFRPTDSDAPPITDLAEFTRGQLAMNGLTTAYVCTNHACAEPTTVPSRLLYLLGAG